MLEKEMTLSQSCDSGESERKGGRAFGKQKTDDHIGDNCNADEVAADPSEKSELLGLVDNSSFPSFICL